MELKAISPALGTPANHGESRYLQMEKTWNSGEPSQDWLADQNSFNDSSQEVTKKPTQTSTELKYWDNWDK